MNQWSWGRIRSIVGWVGICGISWPRRSTTGSVEFCTFDRLRNWKRRLWQHSLWWSPGRVVKSRGVIENLRLFGNIVFRCVLLRLLLRISSCLFIVSIFLRIKMISSWDFADIFALHLPAAFAGLKRHEWQLGVTLGAGSGQKLRKSWAGAWCTPQMISSQEWWSKNEL